MGSRVLAIAKKEILQLIRDKRSLAMIFALPVFQLLLFGYVAANDVRNIRFAVFDQDQSSTSRQIITKIEKSGFFINTGPVANYRDLENKLNSGRVKIGLVIPKGFYRDLKAEKQPSLQVIIDGTDSNTASIARSYFISAINSYAEQIRDERLLRGGQLYRLKPPLDLQYRVYYNPELQAIRYMVPGTMAIILLLITTMLTSLSIVKEKELGTIEQIMVTPVKPWELILGKLAPFPLIGLIDVLLAVTVGSLWFGVPIKGNLVLLFLCSLLFLITSLSMGLLISTVSKTQQQAMLSVVFFLIPNVLLSGFVFPIANMPKIFQVLTYIIPTRYFIEIIRGIYLKGVGIGYLYPQMLALAVIGLLIFIYSVKGFRKQLL
ncbi:MAG: ABC transporter permease [Bacillota bacterium]